MDLRIVEGSIFADDSEFVCESRGVMRQVMRQVNLNVPFFCQHLYNVSMREVLPAWHLQPKVTRPPYFETEYEGETLDPVARTGLQIRENGTFFFC